MRSNHVLAALALCIAAILLLSDRPWHLYGLPGVEEIATLPDSPEFADVRRYTEVGSGLVPHWPGADVPDATARPVMKLGWFHTEYGLARMPFWASSDPGWVTYLDLPRGRQVAILGPSQVEMIDQRLGTQFAEEYAFPWYRKMWGWLVVAGLLAWTFLKRREARIAEDERWAA